MTRYNEITIRDDILDSVNKSLENINTDYLNTLLLHDIDIDIGFSGYPLI